MSRSRHTPRRLALEALDPRLAPAGNVMVTFLSGGFLSIQGDNRSNRVDVQPLIENGQPVAGGFVVRGLPLGDATTINGQSSVTARNVNGLMINLNGGHDQLDLNYDAQPADNPLLRLSQDVTINLGDGADRLRLARLDLNRKLQVTTGESSTGDLGDSVFLRDLTLRSFNDELSIATGPGPDLVDLERVTVANDVDIVTSGGDDTVNLDGLIVDDDLFISTGFDDGSDTVVVKNSEVTMRARIYTYGGDDEVTVDEFRSRSLHLETAGGTDEVHFHHVSVGDIYVHLGSGDNDLLDMHFTAANTATVRGGEGNVDRLEMWDVILIDLLDEGEFEVIIT